MKNYIELLIYMIILSSCGIFDKNEDKKGLNSDPQQTIRQYYLYDNIVLESGEFS